jgi:glycosyltransferase involved in cell wall biosynthesis
MQDKPRIYMTIGTFHPLVGGAETRTLSLCQQLIKQGYQVQIVTFRHEYVWPIRDTVQGIPVLRVAGLLLGRRHRLPRPLQRLMYLMAMLVMSWTIWSHRQHYDILHVCQLNILSLPLACVCRLAHKRMVVVLASAGSGDASTRKQGPVTLLAGPLDPDTPWLKVAAGTWAAGDFYALKSAGKFVVGITRSMLKSMHAVLIVLSTRMLRDLKNNDFLLPGSRVIPNGTDIVRFHPPSADLLQDEQRARTVVCVSQFRYAKGTDVLLQAWRLVHEQMPEARLVLVGGGVLKEQQQKLAAALDLMQSVEFAGLHSDIITQFHRGTIAVLPSRWEGMPNALVEAMACGSACVATRVSGSEDLIQHEVNSLLVEVEDYHALAQALLTLLHDPELVCKYGQAARITIENHFVLDKTSEAYIEVYHELYRNL